MASHSNGTLTLREELVFVGTCDIAGHVRGKGFPARELELAPAQGHRLDAFEPDADRVRVDPRIRRLAPAAT